MHSERPLELLAKREDREKQNVCRLNQYSTSSSSFRFCCLLPQNKFYLLLWLILFSWTFLSHSYLATSRHAYFQHGERMLSTI